MEYGSVHTGMYRFLLELILAALPSGLCKSSCTFLFFILAHAVARDFGSERHHALWNIILDSRNLLA
nr:MAG TPA: hypothetical protein [Caudoviricetes sp.]